MKIILTKGLPGSGKSSWAREYQKQDPNTVLVCKDDLRSMLDSGKHSRGREEFILFVRDSIIRFALLNGKNVIVHDTNLNPIHEERIRQIAFEHNATLMPGVKTLITVEIKDFTDVPLEECIRRDLKRRSSVGERAIRQMYNQYLKPPPAIVIDDPTLDRAIICDIDGTLALFGENNPYDRDFTKDILNTSVAGILWMYAHSTVNIIFVSGRMEKFREQTEKWLHDNDLRYNQLLMRKTDDMRKDVIIKQEIYNEHIKDKYNVLFVLDDRNQVVELWRSLGLTCLQVAEGDF